MHCWQCRLPDPTDKDDFLGSGRSSHGTSEMTRMPRNGSTLGALSRRLKGLIWSISSLKSDIRKILLATGSVAALSGCIPYRLPYEYSDAKAPYYLSYVQQPYQQHDPFACDSECRQSIANGESYDKSQNPQYAPYNLHPELDPDLNSTQKIPPTEGPKTSAQLAECLANAVPEIDPDSTGEGAVVVFLTHCKAEYKDYMSNCKNDHTKKECNEMVGATIGLLSSLSRSFGYEK